MTQHNISINSSDWLNKSSDLEELWDTIKKYDKLYFAESVFICILSIIEVPIMLLTLFALCFLIKSHHAASVYVIHLILSDLIQIICLILIMMKWESEKQFVYRYSLLAGLYFMACIAFERYLLVSYPFWYRTHHSLKSSCFISLIIWSVPLIFAKINPPEIQFTPLSRSIAFFIPYPIIILCFVGTWRGLSYSISLTSHKRKLILGSLFLVLLNYTFLILPHSIMSCFIYIADDFGNFSYDKVHLFLQCLLYLNPLADCLLYLFMRTDAGDIMKSLPCCCRSDINLNLVRNTTSTNT